MITNRVLGGPSGPDPAKYVLNNVVFEGRWRSPQTPCQLLPSPPHFMGIYIIILQQMKKKNCIEVIIFSPRQNSAADFTAAKHET